MFNKKEKNKEELHDRVDLARMEAVFKAILYNYENVTDMKKYFEDIKRYNLSDTEIQSLYIDKKMQKHPVVKKNKIAHDLCKTYGFDEYYSAIKTVKNMFTDNLFDFEIKNNLLKLIETFDKFEKLPLVQAMVREKQDVVKIDNAQDNLEIFTDGEVLSDDKDENGRTIIIAKPTFLIRKFDTDSYQIRFPAIIYGYSPNAEKIPTIKELLHSDQYKK